MDEDEDEDEDDGDDDEDEYDDILIRTNEIKRLEWNCFWFFTVFGLLGFCQHYPFFITPFIRNNEFLNITICGDSYHHKRKI